MNPRLAHTQVILLHEHWHTFDILHNLIPRRSPPILRSLFPRRSPPILRSLFPRHSPPILRSLFPRCYPPVVLQATVGGGEGLEMRLLSQKWEKVAYMWNTNAPYTPSRSPHNALHSPSYWGERSEPHTCGENGKLSISESR